MADFGLGPSTLLQPWLDQFGAQMTPDQLPPDARKAYDDAVGWLNENLPDEREQSLALGLGSIGLQVYQDIRSGKGDAMALFNTLVLSIGALVPAAAPIVALFAGAVQALVAGLQAAGLWAKGGGDPCSQHGEKWYGNVDLNSATPPTGPDDPRWVHWDQDASRGPNRCGWMGTDNVLGGPWLQKELAHPPTSFDAAFDRAVAMALEAYANAKGPPVDYKAILQYVADAWNRTHLPKGDDDWYTARRAAFGKGGKDQQYYSGAWHDVHWNGQGPQRLGADARFADFVLGVDDRTPLELKIHTGPLVPELARFERFNAKGGGVGSKGVAPLKGGGASPVIRLTGFGRPTVAHGAPPSSGSGWVLGGLAAALLGLLALSRPRR